MNLGILILFFYFLLLLRSSASLFYRSANIENDGLFADRDLNVRGTILVATAVSSIFYVLFFYCSTWIWSMHENHPESIFTHEIGSASSSSQQDGIESVVLYCMMIANIVLSLFIVAYLQRKIKQQLWCKITSLFLLLFTGYYLYCIEFRPPMSGDAQDIAVPALLVFLSISLYFLRKKNKISAIFIVTILVSFAGLISTSQPSIHDLTYILSPALRMKYGINISSIYFQYDIFLSLIALLYLKLNIALAWFAYLGQFSFFLLFVSLFFFSDHFFKSKGLSVLFIFALVIVRFYSKQPEWDNILQVSPLRLDLWVILVLAISKKGIYHWTTALTLGLLIIFHRNLGLIYLVAYVELVVFLFLFDIAVIVKAEGFLKKSIFPIITKHVRLNLINTILLGFFVAFCYIMFHGLFSESAIVYRKLGIGMMQIDKHSFYWYVPVVLSSLFVIALFYKEKLGAFYTNTVLFVVLLTIGNSMYFFGRSHENNILNLSAILVLVLFLLFDVCIFLFPDRIFKLSFSGSKQKVISFNGRTYVLLPVLFIFLAGIYYSKNVRANFEIQFDRLKNKQVGVSLPNVSDGVYNVKDITTGSSKVYFLDFNSDFYYYYYGKYCPVGYYSPSSSWIYKADVLQFLQNLLNEGYYILYNTNSPELQDYFLLLKYDEVHQKGNMVSIKKSSKGTSLLPPRPTPQFHTTTMINGIKGEKLSLKEDFTIEVIVKPDTAQVPDAMILNSITSDENLIKGLSFQQNGENKGEYVFCFGNTTSFIPRAYFHLNVNEWNYVAIVVNRQAINVYNNGVLLVTTDANGLPYVNSNSSLYIGDNVNRKYTFRGSIKEISIVDDNINESEIIKTNQKLAPELKIK